VRGPVENAEQEFLEARMAAHVLRYGGGRQ
jgi:hypothetical protein